MSRPARVDYDLEAAKANLERVRGLAPRRKIMAIIKADAYGHGLDRMAAAFSAADAFKVACLEEAQGLNERNRAGTGFGAFQSRLSDQTRSTICKTGKNRRYEIVCRFITAKQKLSFIIIRRAHRDPDSGFYARMESEPSKTFAIGSFRVFNDTDSGEEKKVRTFTGSMHSDHT